MTSEFELNGASIFLTVYFLGSMMSSSVVCTFG